MLLKACGFTYTYFSLSPFQKTTLFLYRRENYVRPIQKRRISIEGVREQGAEEYISTKEDGSNRKLEKSA
jgi:hypothetical protein